MRIATEVRRNASAALLLIIATMTASGCKRPSSMASDAAASASALSVLPSAEPSASTSPPDPLEQHRSSMESAVNEGRYDEVCAGTPSVPSAICTWAAARGQGKAAAHPGGQVLQAFFVHEHIKKVSGTIVGDGQSKGEYEVRVGGYRRHCHLETQDTTFSTTGFFTMWVQENPKTEAVELISGGQQQWVVLEESSFAKGVMDLAHSPNNVEGKGIAEDLMGMIARFVPYSEFAGLTADPPDASTAAVDASPVSPSPTPASSSTPPVVALNALPRVVAATPPIPKGPTRTDCIRKCVASCADDSSCERSCVAKCPAG